MTVLPVILWRYFKCLCARSNAKCPVLMKQYFFILGVLIGQCNVILFFTLLWKLKSWCLAGQKLPSIGFSPRLLGIVWCLSAVVFASAYVGILISFLRFPKLSPIIDRLEDLPGSRLQWVVQRGTALDPLFIVSECQTIIRRIYLSFLFNSFLFILFRKPKMEFTKLSEVKIVVI